jgi:hypothetical protein
MEDSDHDAGNHGKLGGEQDYPDVRRRKNSQILFHDVAEGVEVIRRRAEFVSTFDNPFANVIALSLSPKATRDLHHVRRLRIPSLRRERDKR